MVQDKGFRSREAALISNSKWVGTANAIGWLVRSGYSIGWRVQFITNLELDRSLL
jgi:hypothetical protein